MILRMATTLLAISLVSTAMAQSPIDAQQRVDARIARHDLGHKENNVFLTLATGVASHDQLVGTFKIEYNRQIKGKLFWGAGFSTHVYIDPLFVTDYFDSDYDDNTVGQSVYKLDGMIFYRLPVIASRLFFRVGAGAGVGCHRFIPIDDQHEYSRKIRPYINLEAAWILRVSRGFELKFSPTLILIPSEFSISPLKLHASDNSTLWFADVGASFALGWRF